MTRKTVMTGLAGLILAGAAVLAFGASPVTAAPTEEAQKACLEKASKHEPPLNSIEWEAFMANCLADTATTNGETNGKDN
jgi:hypothetical protein